MMYKTPVIIIFNHITFNFSRSEKDLVSELVNKCFVLRLTDPILSGSQFNGTPYLGRLRVVSSFSSALLSGISVRNVFLVLFLKKNSNKSDFF